MLLQGNWDDSAAGDIEVGLLVNTSAAIPTTIDSQAEVNDLNFVSDLLALGGVIEAAWTTPVAYARQDLVRSVATEDDTNDRVNMDAGNLTWSQATVQGANTHVVGAFCYHTGASDAARALYSVITFTSPIALNGSDVLVAIADLFRGQHP
jgi:hypothetical protein